MSQKKSVAGKVQAPKRKVLIAGGLGVVGRAVVEHLEADPGWGICAVSRREPDFATRARFLMIDLSDRAQCQQVLKQVADVTHVVFAALSPASNPATEVAVNLSLLANLIEGLQATGAPLVHVVLVQGAKVYGAHLGPYRTPAKEHDPRHLPPNFYYNQEDYLREMSSKHGWGWSAVRPSGICGFSVGSSMNVALALALYGSVCRKLSVPFHFPGTVAGFTHLQELTDARLLARAIVWMLTEERCRGEAFNITNGDLIRWSNLWPALAGFFGIEPAAALPMPLSTFIADKEELWAGMVRQQHLHPYKIGDLVGFDFADFLFRLDYDVISDTGKARRFGFQECLDSEAALIELLLHLRNKRIIP